jgi:hypothetical protein
MKNQNFIMTKTGDMPQKVFFGAFWTHSRQMDEAPCQKNNRKFDF